MKKILFSLLLLFSSGLSYGKSNVVVLVVVDQMRADYFHRDDLTFTKGLKKIFDEGTRFENAMINYVPTYTAPGHASLVTGQPPKKHGIIGNRWWDRDKKKVVAAIYDSEHKKSPRELNSPTLGDKLKETHPDAKVISLSLKDRSAIFMGGQNADLVLWFKSKKKRFGHSSYYNGAPAWLDHVNAELPIDSTYDFTSRKHREDFLTSPDSDKILVPLIQNIIDNEWPMDPKRPVLLMVGLSGTDYVGHRYGPYAEQMTKQLKAVDDIMGKLISALDKKIGMGNYVIVLTSDHGVLPVPESKQGQKLKAHRVSKLKFIEAVETRIQSKFSFPEEDWIVSYQEPHLYLNRPLAESLGLQWPAFLSQAKLAIAGWYDVVDAIDPKRIVEPDKFQKMALNGFFPGRSGDLMLRPEEGVLVKPYAVQTGHGSPYDYDTHIPLIFWGKEIKQKRVDREVYITDIAPTIAEIFGLDNWDASAGKILKEVFY